ncbi:DNA methyltransferase Dim-2 [Colletotrichum plurivorum]|uniref:DNA (cytosine-5-)-methyltransferase n=1 Tax=Colletotrichum plurivorum TaxID=2175906 RepID=A0A8H6NJ75_9PEZI|nr:DNA methyltransferase Dim-2 [Colletotrichum plurivorum]
MTEGTMEIYTTEGAVEDSDDGLASNSRDGSRYDEDPGSEVNDDLAKIEELQTLEALENPLGLPADVDDAASDHSQQDYLVATMPETNISVDIPMSTLVAPSYLYESEKELPAQPERELRAIEHLLKEHKRENPGTHSDVEFELDEFSIYSHPCIPGVKQKVVHYVAELRPLQHLSIKTGCDQLFVDGVLSCGTKRYFICQVPFDKLPIGNYGVEHDTVSPDIWIRSTQNADRDIHYRLKNPSTEYRRYYNGFLWIADLTKHVIDYLFAAAEENRDVVFRDFRSNFATWLAGMHQGSVAFDRWRSKYPSNDFCVAIHANVHFIWKEAFGSKHRCDTTWMHLWKEIRDFTAYPDNIKVSPTPALPTSSSSPSSTPPQIKKKTQKTSEDIAKTVVTPYIDELFKHLPFGFLLDGTKPSLQSEKLRRDISEAHKLESSAEVHTSAKEFHDHRVGNSVHIGDVISIPRDSNEESNWTREDSIGFPDVDRWFGLVQKVHKLEDGDMSFDVIWFYRPVDTVCGVMRYPWNNELFLSDHCSCQDGHSKIRRAEVLSIHRVHWGGSSMTDADFFCRQTYLHESRQWVTFQKSHLRCLHHRSNSEAKFPYEVGDTVLVLLRPGNVVDPCELLSLPDSTNSVSLRLLYRRQQLQPDKAAPSNELVYSDDVRSVKTRLLRGRCVVRFFRPDEPIPPPYGYNGTGNAFFITHGSRSGRVAPLEEGFTSLRQGFDPSKPFPKLRGVDLFCGGGNFGRGLEDGGAIEMHWANDINSQAIHTYMANTTNSVHPFVGSIDDMQRLALEGKFDEEVPQIGKVDFVAGGSPCPGFSSMTNDKTTNKQRKNQSLVAAFASFIDTYRPKFGLLENVVNIVQPKARRREDVFCQLICAIIGMGYQAHFFLLDAWSYGSPQSRSRVFLCFAAPGFKLPQMPRHSHSHYEENLRAKTVGKLPNGQSMVERLVMDTPFKFVSTKEATTDLPDIMDGKPDCCISFPDHRLAVGVTKSLRTQLSVIPICPYGMNFQIAWGNGEGIMTAAERKYFPTKGDRAKNRTSRGWGRSFPNKVMQTVTTTPSPTDTRIGRLFHWEQNRVFSVMEARRAQGFRDHEVILGSPVDQWRIIGNSVARTVSVALGMSIREAWLGSLVDGDERVPPSGGDANEEPQEILQENLQPSQEFSQDSPQEHSQEARSPKNKRPLGSSLEIQLFASKIAKTKTGQAAGGSRGGSANGAPANAPANGAPANGSEPMDDLA